MTFIHGSATIQADFISGIKFLDKAGGKVSLVHGENRLYVKDLDWAMVEAWAAEGARKNPSAVIVTDNPVTSTKELTVSVVKIEASSANCTLSR
jgi:hypothetical protein